MHCVSSTPQHSFASNAPGEGKSETYCLAMGLELCFYTCIKLKEGKGYGSVSIARLCSCILHGLTSGPGFSAYRHLLLGTFRIQ